MTPAAIGGSSCGRSMREAASSSLSDFRAALGLRLEGVRVRLRPAIDLRLIAVRAPHDVGRDADDGVASANRTAFDRFQQAAHGRGRR